jgi:hypothetical protein
METVLTNEKKCTGRAALRRHAAFDPRRQREAMLGRAEQLLAGTGGTGGPPIEARESTPEPAAV